MSTRMIRHRRRPRHDTDALADVLTEFTRQHGTARRSHRRPERFEIDGVARDGSVLHRCRRQLAPHAAAAGLLVLAGITNLAAVWAGRIDTVVATVAVIAAGVLGLSASLVHRRVAKRRRKWTLTCGITAAVWLVWATAAGLTWNTFGMLLVAEYLLAARHWKRVRIPNPTAKPIAGRGGVPESTAELWSAHVADDGGVLKGASLIDRDDTEHGERYTVQLVPGRQTLSKALSVLPEISSGLRRPLDEIVLESHPCHDPSRLQLQVITRSPIKQTVFFDRPLSAEGCVHLGPYADGQGDAMMRLYTANSMWGGFVLGGTGSGKSRLIEGVVVTARAVGNTVVFYLDGQDGASSPVLDRHATWSGGTDDAAAMLSAVERIMTIRQKYNRAHALAGFTPSAELPGILVIVDECHAIFDTNNAAQWAHVARAGRKVGVAIFAASQYSGLPTFGGDEALRSSLLAGNAFALRTQSRTAGQLIPGLTLDPAELPELPGYGYTVAAPGSTGRTAPFRNRYLPDDKDKTDDSTIPVPSVQEWMTELVDAELDSMSARAAGSDFLHRHEQAEAKRQALLDEINGTVDEPPQVPHSTPAPDYTDVVTFPDALTAATPTPGELSKSQASVYQAVAGGASKPAEIADTVELSDRRIRQLLGELVTAGHLAKTGYGNYAVSDHLDLSA